MIGTNRGSTSRGLYVSSTGPSSKTYRSVLVDESSSVTSSISSDSGNDLFPPDFDHKRYSNLASPRSGIPLDRTNSHTRSVFDYPDKTFETFETRYPQRSQHEDSKHTRSAVSTSATNGYSHSKHRSVPNSKPGTTRTVSFDTSNHRLSSFSSDDSSRWREIKPEVHHPTQQTMGKPVEKKFLRKVQRELEEQRTQWETEVNNLTGSLTRMPTPSSSSHEQQGESSYVDTSGPKPIFKAFVDLKGYPARNISVNVDSLTNKVVVTALETPGPNGVTRTFTQKIALPRFSDEQALTSRLSKSGMLKIEVPLIYYFPQPDDAKARDRKAKSFVYQVEKASEDGPRVLEILVNTGSEFRAKELKVLVEEDSKLVILGEKHTTDSKGKATLQRKLIKQYTLPDLANVDKITSKLGKDGRLQVNVPLRD